MHVRVDTVELACRDFASSLPCLVGPLLRLACSTMSRLGMELHNAPVILTSVRRSKITDGATVEIRMDFQDL